MSRHGKGTRREARERARLQEIGVKLAVGGLGLFLAPAFIAPAMATALAPLRSVGLVGFVVGAGMLAWNWRSRTEASAADPAGASVDATRFPKQGKTWARPVGATPGLGRDVLPPSTRVTAPRPRPTQWSVDVFRAIEWRRFEAVVEALFAQAGFITKSQSHGADGGVDVWLYSRHQPDGSPVSVVQCKHWQTKPVGVDKVRELRGVMADKSAPRGQFAAMSGFTEEAVAYAKNNQISLLDVHALLGLIGQRPLEQQRHLLEVALEGEYWRPTCANCGTKMVERRPKSGGDPFWACQGYRKCRNRLPIRAQAGER
jgi:restriction system protein